jgi:hypothetical protein
MNTRKRIAITVLLIFGCISIANAAGRLTVEPAVKDFGTIDEGVTAQMEATVKNTGDADVNITNLRTNWACTEGVLGKYTLKPNETTAILITFKTAGIPGPFNKIATISTDIPDQPETEIVMSGQVREAPGAKIQVNPRTFEITAPLGEEQKQVITITNTGSLPLIIKKIFGQQSGKVYFNSQPELVIEPGQSVSKEITIVRDPKMSRAMIAIESNARNAANGLFMIMATGKWWLRWGELVLVKPETDNPAQNKGQGASWWTHPAKRLD